jgi:hypothetical protein
MKCQNNGCDNEAKLKYCSDICRSRANRKPAKELAPRNCEQCGEEYQPKLPKARYCSPECRYECRDQGPRVDVGYCPVAAQVLRQAWR